MKNLALISLVLAALTVLAGCAAPVRPALPFEAPGQPAAPAATEAPALGMAESKAEADRARSAAVPAQASAERMVVYTGALSLQVKDSEEAVAKINDIVKANNGYISNRSLVRDSKGLVRGSIVIRVPAATLDATLTQIKTVGMKVLREDSKSNDVTEEYTDLDARRKNLEAYEVELTKLLETVRERTGKAEDILAVYNQLTEVRGQIEQIKGRQNYLKNTSTLATYTVELVPYTEVTVIEEGWRPDNTARRALRLLVDSLQSLADIVIVLILFLLPIFVILILPFAIVFWAVRRWRRGKRQKAGAA